MSAGFSEALSLIPVPSGNEGRAAARHAECGNPAVDLAPVSAPPRPRGCQSLPSNCGGVRSLAAGPGDGGEGGDGAADSQQTRCHQPLRLSGFL